MECVYTTRSVNGKQIKVFGPDDDNQFVVRFYANGKHMDASDARFPNKDEAIKLADLGYQMDYENLPDEQKMKDSLSFSGYHEFQGDDGNTYGSFEVFHHKPHCNKGDEPPMDEEGWFWWACFPGALPDGEPNGPFPTAEGAYLDAIGD